MVVKRTADPEDDVDFGELPFHDGSPGETQLPAVVDTKPKWELKKLTPRHKRIVQMKMAGLTRIDIAGIAKCTPEYISMILAQPLVKEYMDHMHHELDQDLKDLMGPTVDTLRKTLRSPDDKVALSSAQTILRINGKLGKPLDDEEKLTAEDVVSKLFEIHNSQVQINITPKE